MSFDIASGLVTAITTAFFLLLKPFEWAGIFVPMLPQNALEVMEAPVPFIGKALHCTALHCTASSLPPSLPPSFPRPLPFIQSLPIILLLSFELSFVLLSDVFLQFYDTTNNHTFNVFCYYLISVGTIHTPRPANISPAAAVIYLGDYLGPGEDNFLSPACHLNMQKLNLNLKLKLRRVEDGEKSLSSSNKEIHGDIDNDRDEITDTNVHKEKDKEKNQEKNSSKSYPESCTLSSKSLLSSKEGSTAAQSEEEDSLMTSRVKHNEEKKYFYLPAEYCDQSTQGNGDFCFNIPYKNLKYKMQKTKEKLHHMLASNGSMNTDTDGITDPRTHKSTDAISISVANKCMKKYIFDMTTKECNTVNSLLVAAHGYIAALCGNLTTDCKAWKEWYVYLYFVSSRFSSPYQSNLIFYVSL